MSDTPQRIRQVFPSRQYRYEFAIDPDVLMDEPVVTGGNVYRFILGRDSLPAVITGEAQGLLRDPFAQLVLFAGSAPPLSLRALLAALDAAGFTVHRTFVVSEGGQIPWSPETDDLPRNFRLAIARQQPADPQPDILISASTDLDSAANFLQVIGWDADAGASQFYERRDGVWMWAGSSWEALSDDTRGKGPFDSHVNGAVNMKELKFPWVHWHSPSAVISDAVLAPSDPLRAEPVWTGRSTADDFETTVIRPGIHRWTDSRFARRGGDGRLTDLPGFFRQVLGTSTVNLASSPTSAAAVAGGADVRLPPTFLLNSDALLGAIGLEPDIRIPIVKAAVYTAALTQFDVRLRADGYEFRGDTHFVFVVPEPAFEDIAVLEKLIEVGILSDRIAAAMLMVDFQNSVFSPRRMRLLEYVPAEARLGAPDAFAAVFTGAIRGSPAAREPGSAEAEFLSNEALPAARWRGVYEQRLADFTAAVAGSCATERGFFPVFELAESRRREFRRRKLAEFRLSTPATSIPETASLLEFDPTGNVRPK